MERINMTKYGFVRSPEQDFTDDGSRFTCYKAGDVLVSKLVSYGEVYLSPRYYGDLSYKETSELSKKYNLDRLNGVCLSELTDADLHKLYEDCVNYQKEYQELESKIVYPTEKEISDYCDEVRDYYQKQYDDALKKFIDNIENILDYDSYRKRDILYELKELKDLKNKRQSTYNYLIDNLGVARLRMVDRRDFSNYDYKHCLALINNQDEDY